MTYATKIPRGVPLPWLFLAAAVVTEVIGTSFLAVAAREGSNSGYVIMGVAMALSYYLLSLALEGISIGVAYAIWEGLGVTLLTIIAIVVLGDSISKQEVLGMMLAVAGIICMTLGEES